MFEELAWEADDDERYKDDVPDVEMLHSLSDCYVVENESLVHPFGNPFDGSKEKIPR